MDRNNGLHYHIRWTGKPVLDWACFATRAEAEKGARELVLPRETFTIEEHDESCAQCMKLMNRMPAPDPSNEASQ
jgi:hypothetical protein